MATDPAWQAESDTVRGHIFVAITAGFHVFPLDHPAVPYCDGVKTKAHDPRTCTERGKHPTGKWATMATDDPGVLGQTNYFGGARPHNFAVDCGRSGLVVADEDRPGGWDDLCRQLGVSAPATYTVATAKGRHFYFTQPEDETLTNQAGSLKAFGIDVRGDGGYVVGAGSLHADGVRYTVLDPTPPAPAPAWFVRAIKVSTLRRQTSPSSNADEHGAWWATGPVPEGRRHEAITSAAGWAREQGLSVAMARPYVLDVVRRCAGDEHTPATALAILDDVYARYPAGHRIDATATAAPAPVPHVPERKVPGPLPDGLGETDVDNAARLVYVAAGRVRFVHAWGKWIVYDAGRWVVDTGDVLVTELAKAVARMLYHLAAECRDKKQRRRIVELARRTESARAIGAMVKLARGTPGIVVNHEQLDADPCLLNCTNGTVDLRTGELRRHDPADLCTLQAPTDYDASAAAPTWAACVERWQPDPAVRAYVQARAGAGATGKPTETVDVDYGSGGNGKSKFWGAVQFVLGEYTVIPHKSLLVTSHHEQHGTVVADLFRRRLAIASETSSADVLNDEQVKQLTGGDRLSGRRMREDPWEFNPTHTLVMFSNHRPQVQGRDEGVWRRLRLVPWEVTIPENERDPDLADKLRAEAPGILAWIVAGARTFLAEGLDPPEGVKVATAAYRKAEDTIGRFIADTLVIGDGEMMSGDLIGELTTWAEDEGLDPPPRMNELAEALRALGAHDAGRRMVKRRRGTLWQGVRLAQVADQPEMDLPPTEAF